MLPIALLVTQLALGGAPPIDCDKLCAQVIDACAKRCKSLKKDPGSFKACEAQCETATQMCKEKCGGAKSVGSNPVKAQELRKQMGLEDTKPAESTK